MKNDEELKQNVREKYGAIAEEEKKDSSWGCCSNNEIDYSIFSEDYSTLKGYNPDADLGLGCVAGALLIENYLGKIKKAGFIKISVQKERKIELPVSLLSRYLNGQEAHEYISGNTEIFSVTVYAEKPVTAEKCCS